MPSRFELTGALEDALGFCRSNDDLVAGMERVADVERIFLQAHAGSRDGEHGDVWRTA